MYVFEQGEHPWMTNKTHPRHPHNQKSLSQYPAFPKMRKRLLLGRKGLKSHRKNFIQTFKVMSKLAALVIMLLIMFQKSTTTTRGKLKNRRGNKPKSVKILNKSRSNSKN